jgi:hypothetical protein
MEQCVTIAAWTQENQENAPFATLLLALVVRELSLGILNLALANRALLEGMCGELL